MEKKKLPEIIITGTPQELVEIEPLLVMAGYDKNTKEQNHYYDWRLKKANIVGIKCYENGDLSYRTDSIINLNDKSNFNAREIHKILHYIETGEIKEYVHDKIDVSWYEEHLKYAIKMFKKREEQVVLAEKTMRNSDGSLKSIGEIPYNFDLTSHATHTPVEVALDMIEKEIEKGLKKGTVKETKLFTHTGQTKVVGNRTSTHPVVPKYTTNGGITTIESKIFPSTTITCKDVKDAHKKSKIRDWKKVEKAFKRWSDPEKKNCIGYYDPTQQFELIQFFKKHFTK